MFFQMERAAVPMFGVKAYGVHVNGYVIKGDEMFMWVAKRSPTKQTWPSKLDHIVAGGQVSSSNFFSYLSFSLSELASWKM